MADAQKAESTPSPDTEGVDVEAARELTKAIMAIVTRTWRESELIAVCAEHLERRRTAQNTGRDEVLLDVVDDLGVLDQFNPGDEHFRKQVRRLIEAYKARALSSPPVSTVDEEGGGA